jgi:hypothetical protein
MRPKKEVDSSRIAKRAIYWGFGVRSVEKGTLLGERERAYMVARAKVASN